MAGSGSKSDHAHFRFFPVVEPAVFPGQMNQQTYSQTADLSDPARKSELADFRVSSREQFDDLAHELRQPLSVIDSLAYYLELTVDDEKARGHLRQIQAKVLQANRILSQHREL
jgi:signal transduction histidine kinase